MEARAPRPVKLIVGLLAGRAEWLDEAESRLTAEYGPVDVRSEDIAFTFTDYYREAMGDGLIRRLLGFDRRIDPGAVAAVKTRANAMEAELAACFGADAPARPVNIDPGYVDEAKLILASAKDFAHRIYLRDGIFAEVTLQFRDRRWTALPWTFPDFASGRYDDFLNDARRRLREQRGTS